MSAPRFTMRGLRCHVLADPDNHGCCPDPNLLVGRSGERYVLRLDDAAGHAVFAELSGDQLGVLAGLIADLVAQAVRECLAGPAPDDDEESIQWPVMQ